ncbi:MAG: transporter substrate-binding domain-containing protein [Spirochaetales bacterium]|nr:transporter substrate-binding domain-containing protein [Spirochaetales bacterium]
MSGIFCIELDIDLTAEEEQWLEQHNTIRVSNIHDWIPFSFNENGKPLGFGVDYMNIVAEALGINIEYISGPGFGEYIEMAKNRDIDVILGLVRVEERLEYLTFSETLVRNANVIISRDGNEYTKLEELSGKTVGLTKGTFRVKMLETNYPDIKIKQYPLYRDTILAVSSGEVDAALGGQSGASYFIREYFIEDVSITGIIPAANPEQEQLRLGIRNDWPLLASSIMKAMDAFPRDEYKRIQSLWFAVDDEKLEVQESQFQGDIDFIRIVVIIFIGIVLLNAVGLTIFKKLNIDIGKLKWNGIRITSLAAIAVFICMVIIIASISIKRIEDDFNDEIKYTLTNILSSADRSLSTMISFNFDMLTQYTQGHKFKMLLESLLNEKERNEQTRKALEDYIAETFPWGGESIYLVIDKHYKLAASNSGQQTGAPPECFQDKNAELVRAMNGQLQFLTPVSFPGAYGLQTYRGFFLVPVRDEQQDVIAVLAASYDPLKTLSSITEDFRFGKTAETYAFNRSAVMITESRFLDDLKSAGIVNVQKNSILNVEIKEPGNDEFTTMAKSAVSGDDGWSTDAYRNYRGVFVIGVWRWNEKYSYGITTEVGVEEALERYKFIRRIILLTLAFTLLLATGTTLLSLIVSGKANNALNMSNEDLKKRVEERTAELVEANELFRTASEAINFPFSVISIETGEIVLFNKAARDRDLIRKSPSYKATHDEEKLNNNLDESSPAYKVISSKKPSMSEYDWIDNTGEKHFYEMYAHPIFNEKGDIKLVIEYEIDITDHKKVEEQIKQDTKLLEALIDVAPDSIIIVDEGGCIVQVNHRTETLFGYGQSELSNHRLDVLLPRKFSGKHGLLNKNNGISEEDLYTTTNLETVAVRKNGESFPVDVSFSALKISGEVLIQYIIRDISRRKADEAVLQEHVEELELFNRLTIGREEKMIELKAEVNKLLVKMELPKKYDILIEE